MCERANVLNRECENEGFAAGADQKCLNASVDCDPIPFTANQCYICD